MKQISNYTTPTPPSNITKTSRPFMPSQWVVGIHNKMQARYGHKWTSQHPTPDLIRISLEQWGEVLGNLTLDEVAHGLEAWRGAWPPSAPEFREICRPKSTAAHKRYKNLPRPSQTPETVYRAIEEMRRKVKQKESRNPDNPRSDDCDWFSSHGWSRYKSGEEDLLKMKGLR